MTERVENVTVLTAANVYFDGRGASRAVILAERFPQRRDALPKSVAASH